MGLMPCLRFDDSSFLIVVDIRVLSSDMKFSMVDPCCNYKGALEGVFNLIHMVKR